MSKKMSELCGENPATVPDRNRMGRPINRVCGRCHAARLAGDLGRVLQAHARRIAPPPETSKEQTE